MSAALLPKGTLFRSTQGEGLWRVIGVVPKFNSGMGGAIYHIQSLDYTHRQKRILWVSPALGHSEFELATGLERATDKVYAGPANNKTKN